MKFFNQKISRKDFVAKLKKDLIYFGAVIFLGIIIFNIINIISMHLRNQSLDNNVMLPLTLLTFFIPLFGLIILWFRFMLLVIKRLNGLNESKLKGLLLFIPVINIIFFMDLITKERMEKED